MTFKEFAEAVRAMAGGEYCSASVECDMSSTGEVEVQWHAFVSGVGSEFGHTPELALYKMRLSCGLPVAPLTDLATVGDVPAAVAS